VSTDGRDDLLGRDPLATLVQWMEEARAKGDPEPEAMALASADAAGRPAVRIVLLRGVQDGALRFFTNYESRKGRELLENPVAAAVLHWKPISRQVRVEGPVRRLPEADSDAYFRARPRGHQLSALASPQSREVLSLDQLRARRAELERQYQGQEVPRPDNWGGYALWAERVELWIQGEDRLHERRLFVRDGTGWRVTRLGP